MKSFWIMLCVFALMLCGIVGNGVFVARTADKLEQSIAALPEVPEAEEALCDLEAFWQKRRTAISLSVSYYDVRALDGDLAQMRAAVRTRDATDFETARELALSAVAHLRRLERITVESIL